MQRQVTVNQQGQGNKGAGDAAPEKTPWCQRPESRGGRGGGAEGQGTLPVESVKAC